MSARVHLELANAATATFECTFGRGCDGVCCKNGRPSLSASEQEVVRDHLDKFLPLLRPEARAVVQAEGFLTNRTKLGHRMARVVGGWCVFFNRGCVLHAVGAAEGDHTRYKPAQCVLFPLDRHDDGRWYVRQWGYDREEWDLFCLDPRRTDRKAVETLEAELAYAADLPPGNGMDAVPTAG